MSERDERKRDCMLMRNMSHTFSGINISTIWLRRKDEESAS